MATVDYKLLDILESGNTLCKSFDMDPATARKVEQIYESIKEFEEFPLISAVTRGYHRLVWGFIRCASMFNKDLHNGEPLDLQKFLAYNDPSTGQTALHEAAWFGQLDMVKVLLQYVSEQHLTSYRNVNGCTPLYWLDQDPVYDNLIFATLKAAGKVDPYSSEHQGTMPASKTLKIGESSKTPKMKSIKAYKEIDMSATSYPTSHKNEKQLGLDKLNEGKLERTPNRNTILHLVSKLGDVGYTKSILEKHPSLINCRNSRGETPLYVAARDGNMDILDYLINHIKDDDLKLALAIRDKDKHTALHIAIENHHAAVVSLLVKEIPKLAKCINSNNESPLNLAVERRYYHIFKLILDECNEKAFEGIYGSTALHTAVEVAPECIQDLLREKIELVGMHNKSGWTPLHYAVFYDKLDATIALLKANPISGYQMTKTNGDNLSPIHLAVSRGHQKQIETLVSYCPGCLEMTDSKESNILHVAIQEKKKETFSFILQKYNSVTTHLLFQKDGDGNTTFDLLKTFDKEYYSVIVNHYSDSLYARSNKFISSKKARSDGFLKSIKSAENGRNFFTTKETARNGNTFTPIEKAKQEEEEKRIREREEDEKRKEEEGKKRIEEENARLIEEENDAKQREEEQRQKELEDKRKQKVNKIGDNVVLVITLIATATFAAAFTVPGGFDGDEGMPILLQKAIYKVFVVSNAVAFSCSCCVLFGYVRLQVHEFFNEELDENDKESYKNIINLQYLLTGIAMISMAVAFVTGTYVILTPSLPLAIALCATCVCIIVPFSTFPAKHLGFATKIVSRFEKV